MSIFTPFRLSQNSYLWLMYPVFTEEEYYVTEKAVKPLMQSIPCLKRTLRIFDFPCHHSRGIEPMGRPRPYAVSHCPRVVTRPLQLVLVGPQSHQMSCLRYFMSCQFLGHLIPPTEHESLVVLCRPVLTHIHTPVPRQSVSAVFSLLSVCVLLR